MGVDGQPTAMTSPVGNVLIVEDDAAMREMLSNFLSTQGFYTVGAEDGLEALHLLRSVRHSAPTTPCLVLLDLNMPKMGGIEVLRWIKRQPQLKALRVIVLTSSEDISDVVGMEQGPEKRRRSSCGCSRLGSHS